MSEQVGLEKKEEKIMNNITREAAVKKFSISRTRDFDEAIKMGETQRAEGWLNFVAQNRALFPEYDDIWDFWYQDRLDAIKETV
jgi:hypothetical protein